MKLINSIAFSTVLLSSISVTAQEYNPFTGESIEFIGNWNSNLINNNLVITSESIRNNTATDKFVDVEFYLIPYQENYTTLQLSNPIPFSLRIGKLAADTTLKTSAKIEIDINTINNLKPDNYKVAAILKDRNSKEILANKIFKDVLSFNTSTTPDAYNPGNVDNANIKTNESTSIRKRNKDRIEFSNIIDQMTMTGEWKLDVDFQALKVNIDGVANDIINKKDEATNNLKLYVYFVENLHDGTNKIIEGYEILDADLKPIKEKGEFKNLKLNANITKYIPSGEYYPILMVSELEPDGIYKVKTFIQFENKYIL